MKCPYCGKEMEKGLIQSPNEIAWIKGEKRKLFAKASFHADSVLLSEFSAIKGSAVIAHNCVGCKKIVIDYNE